MTRVAVIQSGSVPFDAGATTDRVVRLTAESAAEGARVAVFPEAFLGTYPKGLTFSSPVGRRTERGRREYQRYAEGAVSLDGPELARVAEAAREHGVFVVLGIVERLGRTLYCTAVLIDPARGLVGHHRKLMPTGSERLIWGFGDGSTLPVVDSPAGRIGTVICWENYMPLLRQAMYARGVEVYCAPTADDRDSWQHTVSHIALEGRCFVLSACQYITRSAYPDDYAPAFGQQPGDVLMRGGSVIVDPLGTVLAGPVFDEETILYADLDLTQKTRSHLDFDPVGHYARPDVFQLTVDSRPKTPVTFEGPPDGPAPGDPPH
ncbi:carbon-nitrogen hydrolase family protein [Streptomyces sp. AJS327]|uniref:carbon-nitrogen hydrolase family protein n=1 Tax=Streptomyces sp. AJS327 TaxID=2545265 RepID=UPI0015DD575A|nr:carbon-nitrogen hydrolase family protein [Streptomyces sp. AJS327]MBA0050608.1 carbon-nitrogen hydrolase family protein [Streptomyces sp. AJS327]